jgi:hypothetical protein
MYDPMRPVKNITSDKRKIHMPSLRLYTFIPGIGARPAVIA